MEWTVTANPHESHLRYDSNKHTNRYQSEWRRHKALPVLTKRNACDYWMGDVSISNGVGEWTGPAIPTILHTLISLAIGMAIVWVFAQRWWALTQWWTGCVAQRLFIHLSVITWSSVEKLRCLFVREEWSECFLWLWCHSCSRTHQEDTHRWDGACLNIIQSGWESLSRVMWRGLANELPYV